MHRKLFAGLLVAGLLATSTAFAQSPAPAKAVTATTPPAATTTAPAAPAGTTAAPAATDSRRKKGNETAKSDEPRAMSLLTFEERKEHRTKMASLKTVDECRAYIDAFWQDIDKRAKEKGVTGPLSGPHADTCDHLKARGQIK